MIPTQLELQFIQHHVEGEIINQRASDGYVNATAMCKSVGKLFADYSRLKTTADFINELSSDMGIPISELIQTLKGGNPENQGTWVHPDIAVNLGQWLSPKFAVQVSRWVRDWVTGGQSTKSEIPVHIRRYMMNRGKIPHTHFSILNELTFNLVAPLEDSGYTLPPEMVPDISEGLIFSRWLREQKNIDTSTFPTYIHQYPDGRAVPARLYPNAYLADFKHHFNTVWLPNHAPKYFKERDAAALPLITMIMLPELKEE